MPAELKALSQSTCLLPGENRKAFETIRQMMIDEIQPETNIEWLWTLDLVELSWEILRYRQLKQKLLAFHRADAIASLLQRLDGAGIQASSLQLVELQSRRNATHWRENSQSAKEIETRLQRGGFDSIAINAEVLMQAQKSFAMFDAMMHAAQNRRIMLLREISIRREFAKRARIASNAAIKYVIGETRIDQQSKDHRAAENRAGNQEPVRSFSKLSK